MGEKNRVIVKKKGFSFLSFFLGILIGIIILAGALFGAGYFAATADLNKVMEIAGLDNKDENGNDKYINTDADDGGVRNMLELVQRVIDMSKDAGGLTLGQIDDLFPAAGGVAEKLRDEISEYVDVDIEELKQVKFSELSAYVNELVMEIRPAGFISGEMNSFAKLFLDGIEADCITVDGVVYPLYSDADGNNYAYLCGEDWYGAEKTDDGYGATGALYGGDPSTLLPTGNYYVDGESKKIYIDPITIGSLTSKDGMGALGRVSVAELLGETDKDGIVEKLLGDITVGQFIDGKADIDARVNALEISDFVEVRADDKVMAFFAYGLSNVTQNDDGTYSAVYKLGEEDETVSVNVEDGKIVGATGADGQPVKGLTVGNVATVSDKIDVSVFLNVTAENKIIAYLAYGITDIKMGEDGVCTAYLGDEKCTLTLKNGEIASVTVDSTGEKVSAANVSELSDRVDGVFNDLKIRDLIDVGDNKLLVKLGEYTLNNVSEGLDGLEVPDVIDVPAGSALMAYLAYGLTKTDAAGGTALLDGENVYVKTENGNITGVYRSADMEGEPVPGTKINQISARIDGLMDELTIAELLPAGATEDNTILRALGNSTINGLSEDINALTVNELYADEIYGEAAEDGSPKKAVIKRVVAAGAPAGEDEINFDPSYLYYTLVSGEFGEASATYKMVGSGESMGKLSSLPADGNTYYTYGKASEFWQLLVTERTETQSGGDTVVTADEKAYSLNNLTSMIENISHNMNYFTLHSLNSAGILKFKNPEDLDKKIPEGLGSYGGMVLGDLTIPDAITAMITIINKLNELPFGS